MRIVIDTNVLVSAAVTGRNPEAVILFIVESLDCEWVVSAEILREYKDVLSRSRLRLTESQKERWFNILDRATILIEVNVEVDFPRDRKDAKFLACALAGEADFLITGDRDFTEAENLTNTTIISVSLFKRLVCDFKELN
ncbi:putative toxin-antitoxin system toxin component, PIN family [Oscillatoriales cyanobacterium USR001]|nr:putative toxin-antitoxin system toxin component, PIN family [Oscillatoriales cyanobacterium USR001]